jgi:hypothetical protein
MRYFNFPGAEVVHIGIGLADVSSISKSIAAYTNDLGRHLTVDLEECARVYGCLRDVGAFPPSETTNWSELIESVHDFATMPLPVQPIVGLRGAVDDPPWFQFLNRRRTQFEFKDYDHIRNALLEPLARTGIWYSWDAS